jgi:putative membrane protein
MMGYGFGFGGFGMILLLGLIVIVVIALAKGPGGTRWLPSPGKQSQRQSALQILDERYARGELDREEYLQRKRDIGPAGAFEQKLTVSGR